MALALTAETYKDNGFELVQAANIMQAWQYENHDLDYYRYNMLYVRGTKISFHSRDEITAYHGKFTTRIGCIELKFSCHGDTRNMKSAILWQRGAGLFKGYDWMGRNITMTFKASFPYVAEEDCYEWDGILRDLD